MNVEQSLPLGERNKHRLPLSLFCAVIPEMLANTTISFSHRVVKMLVQGRKIYNYLLMTSYKKTKRIREVIGYIHTKFDLSVDGNIGYFQFGVSMNSAALDTHVHVFV